MDEVLKTIDKAIHQCNEEQKKLLKSELNLPVAIANDILALDRLKDELLALRGDYK